MVQFKKREKVPRTVVVMSFTGLKRSLGQGNVFTPVCLSTGGRGVMMSLPVMDSTPCTVPTPWTAPPQHHPYLRTAPLTSPPSQQARCAHPTGMLSG